jgi:hypothetical protein
MVLAWWRGGLHDSSLHCLNLRTIMVLLRLCEALRRLQPRAMRCCSWPPALQPEEVLWWSGWLPGTTPRNW